MLLINGGFQAVGVLAVLPVSYHVVKSNGVSIAGAGIITPGLDATSFIVQLTGTDIDRLGELTVVMVDAGGAVCGICHDVVVSSFPNNGGLTLSGAGQVVAARGVAVANYSLIRGAGSNVPGSGSVSAGLSTNEFLVNLAVADVNVLGSIAIVANDGAGNALSIVNGNVLTNATGVVNTVEAGPVGSSPTYTSPSITGPTQVQLRQLIDAVRAPGALTVNLQPGPTTLRVNNYTPG